VENFKSLLRQGLKSGVVMPIIDLPGENLMATVAEKHLSDVQHKLTLVDVHFLSVAAHRHELHSRTHLCRSLRRGFRSQNAPLVFHRAGQRQCRTRQESSLLISWKLSETRNRHSPPWGGGFRFFLRIRYLGATE
jgi:hypothetical protein